MANWSPVWIHHSVLIKVVVLICKGPLKVKAIRLRKGVGWGPFHWRTLPHPALAVAGEVDASPRIIQVMSGWRDVGGFKSSRIEWSFLLHGLLRFLHQVILGFALQVLLDQARIHRGMVVVDVSVGVGYGNLAGNIANRMVGLRLWFDRHCHY